MRVKSVKSEAGPFWGVRLGGCVFPISPFGRWCFPTSSVWVAVLSYLSPFGVVLGVVLSFTLFCSFDTKKQLYEVKLRHNYSKLKEKKVKLWAALLILGGAAFLLLPFLAVLIWLVLHFRSCLVWCGFPFVGGAAVSSFLLSDVPLYPSSSWVLLVLSLFFGGAAFSSSLLVVLLPSTTLGVVLPLSLLELY